MDSRMPMTLKVPKKTLDPTTPRMGSSRLPKKAPIIPPTISSELEAAVKSTCSNAATEKVDHEESGQPAQQTVNGFVA